MSPVILWILFALYSLAVIGLSFRTTGREPDAKSFWSGGEHGMNWLQLAISLSAGWLMLGWIGFGMGQIYMLGATGLWILPLPWIILLIGIAVFVPLYRRVPFFSIADAMDRRFGKAARRLTGLFSLGVFLSWTGAELVMVKKLLGNQLGLKPEQGWIVLLLFVIPIMIYTWRGGFRAIVHTDMLQFGLMALFMIALLAQAWRMASAASPGGLMNAIAASRPPWLGEDQDVFAFFNLGLLFPLVLLVGYLPGWAIEQDLWLRLQAARSTREARFAALGMLTLVGVFVIAIPTAVGFLSLAAFPPEAGVEAAAVGGEGSWAIGIVSGLIGGMPPLLSALMFLGIVSCQMSTVDTFANVTALALGNDLIGARGTGGRKTGRIASLIVLGIAFFYALWADRPGDIYYVSSGVLSAAIAIPLMSWGWRRAGANAVVAASIIGAVSAVLFYWVEYKYWELTPPELLNWLAPSTGYNYLAACVILSAGTLLGVAWIAPAEATVPVPDDSEAVCEAAS